MDRSRLWTDRGRWHFRSVRDKHAAMSDDLQAQIDGMTWFHTLRLGRFSTPGQGGFPPNWSYLATLKLIEDIQLHGAHCADVGTLDGLVAFALAERGAARVEATELESRPQFLLARSLAGLDDRVHYHPQTHLDDLEGRWGAGPLDVLVLARGLERTPTPLTALFACRRLLKSGGLLILETACCSGEEPVLAINTELAQPILNEYATPYLVPTRRAVEGMLRLAAFDVVATYDFEGRARTTMLAKAVRPDEVRARTPLLTQAHARLSDRASDRWVGKLGFHDLIYDERTASTVRYFGPTGRHTLDTPRYRPMVRFQPAYAALPSPVAARSLRWRDRLPVSLKTLVRVFRWRKRA